jgi:hypothetical protein
MVVILGPSGQARFSASLKAPGAIVVPPMVLNAVNVPVRITAKRADGGSLVIATAASIDARAILASSAVTSVNGVQFPSRALDLHASGVGPLTDIAAADIWRLSTTSNGSAVLVVDQSRAPETAVVSSGDTTDLSNVTVTLTWANRGWFFEALTLATIGAVLAAFALNDLWQGRIVAVGSHAAGINTSEARV